MELKTLEELDGKRYVPWVAIAFAVANVASFAWEIFAGAPVSMPDAVWMYSHGGNFGPVTLDGEQWRLLTSMFLHYGAIHLVINLIGLLDGGRTVEKMYGHTGFVAIYLVSGLAGSLASAVRGVAVSAGASGAIFGVFGAFAAFLVLHRKRLDPAQVKKQSRGLVLFVVINVWLGLSIQGIDILAHAGGFGAGFLLGLALEIGTHEDQSTPKRSLLVGLLGAVLVLGASMVVPHRGNAQLAFVLKVVEAQRRGTDLLPAIRARSIPEDKLAERIESEVLKPWNNALETVGNPPMSTTDTMTKNGWEEIAQGLRTRDPDLVKKGQKRIAEAKNISSVLTEIRQ